LEFENKNSIHSIKWGPAEMGLFLAACSGDGMIAIFQQGKTDWGLSV